MEQELEEDEGKEKRKVERFSSAEKTLTLEFHR
jgi:hypothetical protein